MGLYDSYQLSNSQQIPRYQGSAIPELEKVASAAQQRYDTSQNYMDATQQAMSQSQAIPADQAALNQLNEEKQGKLKEFAKRPDLENIWRETMMEAKDYANKSKYFADNARRVQDFHAEIDKRQQEGKINAETARAAKAASMDGYKGLQPDGTGKYTNQFTGQAVMSDVDIPKKINTWLADAHPEIRGGEVKKDVNGWYITNGTETKRLPMDRVMQIVNAGVDSDPEVMPWIRQESSLAPYKAGITGNIPDQAVVRYYQNNPQMMAAIQQGMANHKPAAKVVQEMMSATRGKQLLDDIKNYASKGVVSEIKTKHEEEMDPVTVERLKKEQENQMIPMNYVAENSGQKISSVGDYEDVIKKGQQEANDLAAQYERFRSDPSRKFDQQTGKLTQVVNGQEEDATPQLTQMYGALQSKLHDLDQLRNIKGAAAATAGYDPSKAPKSVVQEAAFQRDNYLEHAIPELSIVRNHTMGKGAGAIAGYRTPTQEEIDQVHATANKMYSDALTKNTPRYKEYEEELKKRLNFGDEQSKIWGMPNDKMKEELGDMLTGLSSKVGLKDGMLSFNIANGADQGKQIEASTYDEIKGKVTPIGITHSSKDGSTQVIVRANEDIKGKKTQGENLILSVPDGGWVDDYVKKRMAPQDRHQFYMDAALKSGLNNYTGTMKWENVTDKEGRAVPISIRRNRASNSGDNAFLVTVPGQDGRPVQVPVNSYEGVTNLIDQIQAEYHK